MLQYYDPRCDNEEDSELSTAGKPRHSRAKVASVKGIISKTTYLRSTALTSYSLQETESRDKVQKLQRPFRTSPLLDKTQMAALSPTIEEAPNHLI
jgi:hypothetical protein